MKGALDKKNKKKENIDSTGLEWKFIWNSNNGRGRAYNINDQIA